jgi:hypothetical protein
MVARDEEMQPGDHARLQHDLAPNAPSVARPIETVVPRNSWCVAWCERWVQ